MRNDHVALCLNKNTTYHQRNVVKSSKSEEHKYSTDFLKIILLNFASLLTQTQLLCGTGWCSTRGAWHNLAPSGPSPFPRGSVTVHAPVPFVPVPPVFVPVFVFVLYCVLLHGLVCCGVVRCGVVWCGVMWCDVVWCGVVWCGVVWCGVMWCDVVWCGVVWCGVVWCGVVWCGVV